MKTAVIDTGGGLRGIYGAGVFDYCITAEISFSHCIGVSAGSANAASFLAGQKGRNFRFYTEYAQRREYMSPSNMLKKHSYLDLDYIYGSLSNISGEDPLDFEALRQNPSDFTVVATDAETGSPVYFSKDDMAQDNYSVLKASCCIPGVCKAYGINGKKYYDGGVSDAIPVDFAFSNGTEKAVLILTKPINAEVSFDIEKICAALLRQKYPNTAKALLERGDRYFKSIEVAKRYENDGRLLIIAPNEIGHLKTLTKDIHDLAELYDRGKRDAEKISRFIQA